MKVFKSKHRMYHLWNTMMRRCYDPRHKAFQYYGQKGIKVCKRWHDFYLFIEDMGSIRPANTTLNRINNNSLYSKNNCEWASIIVQNRNRSCVKLSLNKAIQIRKSNLSLKQLEIIYGVSMATISRVRNNKNWKE